MVAYLDVVLYTIKSREEFKCYFVRHSICELFLRVGGFKFYSHNIPRNARKYRVIEKDRYYGFFWHSGQKGLSFDCRPDLFKIIFIKNTNHKASVVCKYFP